MMWRKPVQTGLLGLSIVLVPACLKAGVFLLAVPALLMLIGLMLPMCRSKCPRCRKDNILEPWVIRYNCVHCRGTLYKEKEGWSRTTPQKKGSRV